MFAFNYWHYISFTIILLLFIAGVASSLMQTKKKMMFSMLFSVSLVTVFLLVFSVIVVDKYTKKVALYKLQNRRLLNIEKIAYTGMVKNVGKFKVAKVIFEIKLVNRGNATGNVKAGSFYKPSGFLSFFSSGLNIINKPQSVKKSFVVAKNLKPGEVQFFRVDFPYPPYFNRTAQFPKVYAH